MMSLTVGQRVRAPFWAGVAEVKQVVVRRRFCKLEVVLENGQYLKKRLLPEQLVLVEVVQENELVRVERAEDFFFFIEAHRIRLAYQFDPQLAVNVSQVDPLPHQIEAV